MRVLKGQSFLKKKVEILYEDKYLIALNKLAGLVVQGARSEEESLFYKLKNFLKERDAKPGNVFLAILHRLDKPVSGALLFAKRSKTAAKVFKLIQEKRFEKVYFAIVHGKVEKDWGRWIDFTEEGKRAITYYQVLSKKRGLSLLFLYPYTGRKHQLRKALSLRGHPILGDLKYGSRLKIERGKALLLHSLYLTFPHPQKEETVEIFAPLPSYFASYLGRFTLDKEKILEFLNRINELKEKEDVSG